MAKIFEKVITSISILAKNKNKAIKISWLLVLISKTNYKKTEKTITTLISTRYKLIKVFIHYIYFAPSIRFNIY